MSSGDYTSADRRQSDEIARRLDRIEEKMDRTHAGFEERITALEVCMTPEAQRKMMREELRRFRVERDAAAYQQLTALGWRLVGAVVGSSVAIKLLLDWVTAS